MLHPQACALFEGAPHPKAQPNAGMRRAFA
ncbi:hypothetical protein J2X67_003321 [Variovorax sp. 3319]|nr:hypothetical protein [Variovorax sp. 3319]